jgi:hypothetical protein
MTSTAGSRFLPPRASWTSTSTSSVSMVRPSALTSAILLRKAVSSPFVCGRPLRVSALAGQKPRPVTPPISLGGGRCSSFLSMLFMPPSEVFSLQTFCDVIVR